MTRSKRFSNRRQRQLLENIARKHRQRRNRPLQLHRGRQRQNRQRLLRANRGDARKLRPPQRRENRQLLQQQRNTNPPRHLRRLRRQHRSRQKLPLQHRRLQQGRKAPQFRSVRTKLSDTTITPPKFVRWSTLRWIWPPAASITNTVQPIRRAAEWIARASFITC